MRHLRVEVLAVLAHVRHAGRLQDVEGAELPLQLLKMLGLVLVEMVHEDRGPRGDVRAEAMEEEVRIAEEAVVALP